jgi:hypothetical protein
MFYRYEWRENPEPERYGSAIHTGKPLITTIPALEKCALSFHAEKAASFSCTMKNLLYDGAVTR